MEFLQILFAVLYLGTPLFIVYRAVKLTRRAGGKSWQAMLVAMGLWLLQAAVLIYFVGSCISGHCMLTPIEEYGPLVLMAGAYIGIGWILWVARGQVVPADNAAPPEPKAATDKPTCCKKPRWRSELDLDSAGGFEFQLGKCRACGAYGMNVFCGASGITGYEPVSASDVEHMKSIPAGPERKAFMRQWGDRNL